MLGDIPTTHDRPDRSRPVVRATDWCGDGKPKTNPGVGPEAGATPTATGQRPGPARDPDSSDSCEQGRGPLSRSVAKLAVALGERAVDATDDVSAALVHVRDELLALLDRSRR